MKIKRSTLETFSITRPCLNKCDKYNAQTTYFDMFSDTVSNRSQSLLNLKLCELHVDFEVTAVYFHDACTITRCFSE